MNKRFSYFLIAAILVIAIVIPASAQFGIGTTTPDPSAALDIVSTTQGVLHPRLTTTERDAISSPAEGLTIYNTTAKCLQVYDGTAWNCAVGGSDADGGTTLVKSIDNSVSQAFAIDDYKRFFGNPALNMNRSVEDITWIDDNTLAVYTVESEGTYNFTHYVTLYSPNYGIIREFSVASLQSGVTGGRNGSTINRMFPLANGNLVLISSFWSPPGKDRYQCDTTLNYTCWAYAIVDQQGNEVKGKEHFSATAASVEEAFALDNGNFVIHEFYKTGGTTFGTKTRIFDEDGVLLATNSENMPNGEFYTMGIAPTNFGYVMTRNEIFKTYNYSGTLQSTINNWFDATLYDNPLLSTGDNATTSLNIRMDRGEGNELYVFGDRGLLRAVASTNAVTVTHEIATDVTSMPSAGRLWLPIGDTLANGRLLFHQYKYHANNARKVPVGVFADGTPLLLYAMGIPVAEYDTNANQLIKRNYISLPPGTRIEQSYSNEGYGPADQYNFGSFTGLPPGSSTDGAFNMSEKLEISPDKTKVFHMFYLNDQSYVWIIYDISNIDNFTQLTHVALNNGEAQHMGKRFVLTGPVEQLKQVDVTLTDGYQSGDALSSACTPGTVSATFIANILRLQANATTASMQEFITCLNEMMFATTQGAGERTITVQATDENDALGEIMSFTLNVGSN